MHGTNPIRPPVTGDGAMLEVQHIFPTLQGEGPYAGVPAVFIRLGGCNLACTFCDTEFESFKVMGVREIVEKVDALSVSSWPEFAQQNYRAIHVARVDPSYSSAALNSGDDEKRCELIVITGGGAVAAAD